MYRDICSSMTMDASTTIPRATTKLDVVIRLIVWPVTLMAMKVNRKERGIDDPMTRVALGLFRNRKMTMTAMMIPVIPEVRTLDREFFMLFASSENIL